MATEQTGVSPIDLSLAIRRGDSLDRLPEIFGQAILDGITTVEIPFEDPLAAATFSKINGTGLGSLILEAAHKMGMPHGFLALKDTSGVESGKPYSLSVVYVVTGSP